MNDQDYIRTRPAAATHKQYRQRTMASVFVVALLFGGVVAYSQRDSSSHKVASAAEPGATTSSTVAADAASATTAAGDTATTAATADTATADSTVDNEGDAVGAEPTAGGDGCQIVATKVRPGATGADVSCIQAALKKIGYYTGNVSGVYDGATAAAVKKLQTDKDLFVDGVVGRESALILKVWPPETLHVVRTPPPKPGAVDLLGYKLSSVATSGPDAPPLPPNSGSGKRLVYSRDQQRVWAVSAQEVVIRSWLVSGSRYPNEHPGVHKVFSRSELSTAWNGKAYLHEMVRYDRTPIGAIGFHALPIHVADGTANQTDAELGTRLSGGCTRQANLDADFTWAFAQIGTTVVVV